MSSRAERKQQEQLDLTCSAKTTEEIKVVLGYPDIFVEPKKRPIQCPNCGRDNHTLEQCKVPPMEKLFAMFGNSLFDTTDAAIANKRAIVQTALGSK